MNKRFFAVGSLAMLGAASGGLVPGCGGGDVRRRSGVLLDGGTGGSGGSGTVPAALVGKACTKDTDCATGLFCATATGNDMLGGPANGVCTADCSINTDACLAVDPNSICVTFNASGSVAFCLETCTLGPTARGEVKCLNRSDMGCADAGFGDGSGYCSPACRGDFDCSGRSCDLSSGLCTDASKIAGTKPIGSSCDPNSTTEVCKGGFCLTMPGGGGMCSGFCTLGTAGCGEDPTASRLDTYCLFTFDPTLTDVGDQGFCGQVCDCDGDCLLTGSVCAPDQSLRQSSGRLGYCTPKVASDGSTVAGMPCVGDAGVKPDSGTPGRGDSGVGGSAADAKAPG